MWIVYDSKIFKFAKRIRIMPSRFIATTLFEWVLTDRPYLGKKLTYHEFRHVQQYRWHLYVFFLPMYFLLLAIFGYKDHPYEADARRYADRMMERDKIREKRRRKSDK